MKVEWIAYGADKDSDAGWRILGKSAGITQKEEKLFRSMYSDVPMDLVNGKTYDRLYFGGELGRRRFLCCGDYMGKDRFGREGAWTIYVFIVPTQYEVVSPYALTEMLWERRGDINSKDPINLGDTELPRFSSKHEDEDPYGEFVALFAERRELVFAIPQDGQDGLEKAGAALDGLVGKFPGMFPSYLFPVGKNAARFDIVGVPLVKASGALGVIPLARVDPARRWWKRAVAPMTICAVAGVSFGLWECAAVQTQRREREKCERRLSDIRDDSRELRDTSRLLRDVEVPNLGKLADILKKGQERGLTRVGFGNDKTTHHLTGEHYKDFCETLSQLLESAEKLDKTLKGGDHTPKRQQ